MVNWTEILSNKTGSRLVEEFAKGNINRDNMIVRVPQLRQVIRNKGVSRVRQMAKKSLKRRGVSV